MKIDIKYLLLLVTSLNTIGSTHTIIHEDLNMRKVCFQWVLHLLPDDKKKKEFIMPDQFSLNLFLKVKIALQTW